ncbi:murein biosynthesis integral membrane protein MurJ [Candidatus Uhrbacteria bacterium]|nr:murein biosynthesis integral membrane protein MurJ [Candidatus Uhrbacteria bacterium]
MADVSQQKNGVAQPVIAAAVLIAILSLASRVLGLVRDRLLAGTFGAGPTLDAYYAAFRIPDLLFNLLGLGALTAAFLPVYLRIRGGDVARARAFAAMVMSDVAVALLVLCGIGFAAAGPIYRLLVPGFTPEALAITVALGRVMFVASFLLGCSTVVGGVLQAEERFAAFAAAPLAYNAGIIMGVVAFVPLLGPYGLAWGVVLGALLHLVVQWIAARRVGFRASWRPTWRDPEVRRMGGLLLPRMLGLAANQLQLVLIMGVASTLAAGSIAVFTFASNIQMVPIALIGISFAVASFPYLSIAAQHAEREQFRERFSSSVRQIALFALPAVVLLLTLKAQIVRVLLGSGQFGWDDTIRTLGTLEAFGFGLFWAMLLPLLTRSFYAFEDTWTPFLIGLLADVVAVIAAIILGRSLGPRGLGFAASLAVTVQAVLLLTMLRARVGPLDGWRITTAITKCGVAALVMAITIQLVKPTVASLTGTDTFLGIGLQGTLAALLGTAVYLGIGLLLRSPEITTLARTLHRGALRTIRLPPGGADEARG